MKSKILLTFLILLISQTVSALPTAKITVEVIDEHGNAIEGARTGIGFRVPNGHDGKTRVTGLTNSAGLFTSEGETISNFTFSAKKEGNYATGHEFYDFTDVTGFYGFRKYEPWNPTLPLVLKKIINPIAMYAVNRGAHFPGELPEIPEIGKFVGYDLEVNDWVVPHGLGTHRDFLFKVDIERGISYRDFDVTLTLKFSNPGDGLVKYTPDTSKGKSALRLPHHAPVTGYESEYVKHYESKPGEIKIGVSGNPDFDNNYFFRVRTELDDEGNVVGGLYGKIHSQIKLSKFIAETGGTPKPNISFNYYLNPNNNDTNIEFDPEKNLFKGVTDRLKVSQP